MPRRTNSSFPPQPASLASFGAALRKRRRELGLTLDRLAAATGISKPYLSNIEIARAPGPPSEDKLRVWAEALHLPVSEVLLAADWLRTPTAIQRLLLPTTNAESATQNPQLPRRDDGTINLDALLGRPAAEPITAGKAKTEAERHPPLMPVRQVPLINRVAAGRPEEFTDLGYPAGFADRYLPAPAPAPAMDPAGRSESQEHPDLPAEPPAVAFALRVIGDSMSPDYQAGEIVLVGGESSSPRDGDDCVVRFADEENYATTFKRIYFMPEGSGADATGLRLVPLNPAHAEWTVPLERVTGIYPVLYRLLPAKRPSPATTAGATAPPPERSTSQFSLEQD